MDAFRIQQQLRQVELCLSLLKVHSREKYAEALGDFAPQMIIANYDFDGFEAFHLAREKQPLIPFIFVGYSEKQSFWKKIPRLPRTSAVLSSNLERVCVEVERFITEMAKRAPVEKNLSECRQVFY